MSTTAVTMPRLSAAERAERARQQLEVAQAALTEAENKQAVIMLHMEQLARETENQAEDLKEAVRTLGECANAADRAEAAFAIAQGTVEEAETAELVRVARDAIQFAQAGVQAAMARRREWEPENEAQKRRCDDELEQAAETIAKRRRIAQALEAQLDEAQARAGQDRLQALRAQHAELKARREEAYAAVDAVDAELRAFIAALPDVLAPWPEMAKLPVSEVVDQPLKPEREILEACGRYLDVLCRHAAITCLTIGGVNTRRAIESLNDYVIDYLLSPGSAELKRNSAPVEAVRRALRDALERFG